MSYATVCFQITFHSVHLINWLCFIL